MLDGLPNCVFDVSGPLRQYSKQARAVSFLAKMAELSAVGALMGGVTSLLSTAAVEVRKKQNPDWQPSTAIPDVARSSGGLAAYFAVNANVRCASGQAAQLSQGHGSRGRCRITAGMRDGCGCTSEIMPRLVLTLAASFW